MHAEAYQWVAGYATAAPVQVLDIGGRDLNGTVRDLFPQAARYTVLDLRPGRNVDVVADAAAWTPDRAYDVVVCCEVFEHTPVWAYICHTAYRALKPGGLFVATMAGPGRPAHSGVDAVGAPRPGEHYRNIDPETLRAVLDECGFVRVVVDRQRRPDDVRVAAWKSADPR